MLFLIWLFKKYKFFTQVYKLLLALRAKFWVCHHFVQRNLVSLFCLSHHSSGIKWNSCIFFACRPPLIINGILFSLQKETFFPSCIIWNMIIILESILVSRCIATSIIMSWDTSYSTMMFSLIIIRFFFIEADSVYQYCCFTIFHIIYTSKYNYNSQQGRSFVLDVVFLLLPLVYWFVWFSVASHQLICLTMFFLV